MLSTFTNTKYTYMVKYNGLRRLSGGAPEPPAVGRTSPSARAAGSHDGLRLMVHGPHHEPHA